MGLNIAEKQLLKSLEAQEKSGVLDMRPGGKEQLEELREKQGDDQSSIFDKIGIFSTAQASEIDPNNLPSMLPTGAMDRQTPFGDRILPEVPGGGGIFSGRQFGNIRGGITEGSVGQRYNVNNPESFFNTVAGQARATEDNNFFDYLKDLSGGFVDFAKDVGGSFLGGQTGAKAALQFGINPLIGFGIGALKGTGLFDPVGRGMAPELQRGLYDEYGGDNLGRLTSGIMQGYNPRGGNLLISAVDRRQNILRNLKNPRARARGFTGRNLPALDKFIDDQVKVQTDYYGGTGATDVTGSSDYTSTGSPQSMGSARGGAGGRPY
jgi:hypothetical protein